MIRWAGWLITLYAVVHTVSALTVEGAAQHAGSWLRGDLWGEDLADMSAANSAYWLSLSSFGVPLLLVGLTVLWLDRRGITPPLFLACTLAGWTLIDAVVNLPSPWPVLLVAAGLLYVGSRRAGHPDQSASSSSAVKRRRRSTTDAATSLIDRPSAKL